MLIKTIIFFFALKSCQEAKINSKTHTYSNNIDDVKISKVIKSDFSGNFSGIYNQKEIFLALTAMPKTNKIKGGYGTDLVKCGRYTSGKTLFLVNLKTQQATPTIYYAEENRIMLTIGDTKRVF